MRNRRLPPESYFQALAKYCDLSEHKGEKLGPQGKSQKGPKLEAIAKTLEAGFMATATSITPQYEPPDLSSLLPPPYEWCEIPAGNVLLVDATDRAGTAGGKYGVDTFFISKYPITTSQFQKFLQVENGFFNSVWWDYSESATTWNEVKRSNFLLHSIDNKPCTSVSWYDAVAFCIWLNSYAIMSPLGMYAEITLPTEQQWQRAAQGNDARLYPWGNEVDSGKCNIGKGGKGSLTSVTAFPTGVNPFGVFDMSGNAWEWCLTKWGADNPELDGDGVRVLKGGSWYNDQHALQTFFRWEGDINRPSPLVGFRIVYAINNSNVPEYLRTSSQF